MTAFRVKIVFEGIDLDNDEVFDAVTSIDDVVWTSRDGQSYAHATVVGTSPVAPSLSLATRVRALVPSAQPRGLDEDLVAVSDIAARVGVSREAVRNWANGSRGPNTFPAPRGVVGDRIKVWDWASVNTWLSENLNLGDGHQYPSEYHIAVFATRCHLQPTEPAVAWTPTVATQGNAELESVVRHPRQSAQRQTWVTNATSRDSLSVRNDACPV